MTAFLENLKGIIVSPGKTLGRLMDKKQWVANLVLILSIVFIFTYISAPRMLESTANTSEWIQEQFEQVGTLSGFRLVMAAFWAVLVTLITMTIAAFMVYLFYGISRAEGQYANYFSLVVNASLIGTVFPMLIGLISMISGLPLLSFLNPATLLSMAPNTLAFLVVSKFDIFYLWYLAALAAGVSVFSKMSLKKSLLVAFLYFLFISAIKTSFSWLALKILSS
jgi:hypothetical protein